MRLLILNYEFPPLGGGAAHATYNILKEFAGLDELEADVVVSSPDKDFKQIDFNQRIRVYKIPIGKHSGGMHYQTNQELIIYGYKAYRFTKNLLKEKKYQLCHAFFSVPCGYVAYRLRNHMPYIVALRGSDVPGYNLRFSLLYKFITPSIKKVWHAARAVVANSQGLKELALMTDPQQKIEVICNGIDTGLFKPKKTADGIFRILCVARLIERKGIRYLIEATAKLLKTYPNIKLILVGEGNIELKLREDVFQRGITEQVEFMGLVSQAKLPEIYNQAGVFVLPSLNEGMSNTVLEAMACGLPIIATDTGGTAELLRGNGFCIPLRDSGAIYDCCLKLIEDENLRQAMGRKSREIAEGMSWRSIAAEYLSLYKRSIVG
jgi:glycosyltransferase involved in cell wall biosynthesis